MIKKLEAEQGKTPSNIDLAAALNIKVEEVDKKTATNANNINNLTTRVSTAESKITPNAIINTVKNSTDSNGNKTFVTNSELAQYSDKFVYSFGNSNGYNLVQNGSFNGTTKGWRINNSIATLNDFSTTTTSECNLTRFGKVRNNNASQVFIYSNRFALEAGQKYTFSFYGKQSNLKSMSVKLYYYNSGLTTSNITTCNTAGATGSLTLMSNKSDLTSSWKRYYATFSTSTSMKSAFLYTFKSSPPRRLFRYIRANRSGMSPRCTAILGAASPGMPLGTSLGTLRIATRGLSVEVAGAW